MKICLSCVVVAIVGLVVVSAMPGGARAADQPAGAGATSAPATQPDQGGPLKFYGTISAIDAQAKTFIVDNQVYHVVAESHMTKAADDSAATLDDAKVGEPARGTYTRSSDGQLNVTKVRFGKKAGGKAGGGKAGGKKKSPATTTASDQ